MTLHETIQGGVATIVMDNPPVNALGSATPTGWPRCWTATDAPMTSGPWC